MTVVACGSGIASNFGLVRTEKLDIIDSSDTAHMSLSATGGGQIVFHARGGSVQLDATTLRRLLASTQTAPAAP